jgi:acetyl esterase/lipase
MDKILRTNLPLVITLVVFSLVLASCSPAEFARPTPSPSLAPFDKYGQALTDVPYCTMDGQPQKTDLYLPGSGGPWPVFLYVHGGGWNQGDKAEGAGWRYLNAKGYLVVSINYRLAAYNLRFPAMIEDVKCAVRSLRAHAAEYNLDPSRIAVLGASAGGHLAALLGTSDKLAGWDVGEYLDQSSRVQAVVAEAVFSDFTRPLPDSIATVIFIALGELPGTTDPVLSSASPVTYITPDDPPFLIIHGEKDGFAPLEQAEILDARLKSAGVSSKLVIVQNGQHGLMSSDGNPTVPTAQEINQDILDFLNANLVKGN